MNKKHTWSKNEKVFLGLLIPIIISVSSEVCQAVIKTFYQRQGVKAEEQNQDWDQ